MATEKTVQTQQLLELAQLLCKRYHSEDDITMVMQLANIHPADVNFSLTGPAKNIWMKLLSWANTRTKNQVPSLVEAAHQIDKTNRYTADALQQMRRIFEMDSPREDARRTTTADGQEKKETPQVNNVKESTANNNKKHLEKSLPTTSKKENSRGPDSVDFELYDDAYGVKEKNSNKKLILKITAIACLGFVLVDVSLSAIYQFWPDENIKSGVFDILALDTARNMTESQLRVSLQSVSILKQVKDSKNFNEFCTFAIRELHKEQKLKQWLQHLKNQKYTFAKKQYIELYVIIPLAKDTAENMERSALRISLKKIRASIHQIDESNNFEEYCIIVVKDLQAKDLLKKWLEHLKEEEYTFVQKWLNEISSQK
ncbi:effector-associated domain EAD1-containing protein [Candidatus Uabimicrobium sp. HlEnr_7]|uniref:effector-associated domain EAD1-containing protein n=1 Tax=Candidatus Uabimicrobium helgolandensis TaxID=3095367 RepID=UPI003558FCDA